MMSYGGRTHFLIQYSAKRLRDPASWLPLAAEASSRNCSFHQLAEYCTRWFIVCGLFGTTFGCAIYIAWFPWSREEQDMSDIPRQEMTAGWMNIRIH